MDPVAGVGVVSGLSDDFSRRLDVSIGVGIFLMVVGAILAFAVRDSWSAVDLTVVGSAGCPQLDF